MKICPLLRSKARSVIFGPTVSMTSRVRVVCAVVVSLRSVALATIAYMPSGRATLDVIRQAPAASVVVWPSGRSPPVPSGAWANSSTVDWASEVPKKIGCRTLVIRSLLYRPESLAGSSWPVRLIGTSATLITQVNVSRFGLPVVAIVTTAG